MNFRCPGCAAVTPGVEWRAGRPVYCTQCGRGYRFAYGFYHRYLYWALNHPVLTYALLFPFALAAARSFRGLEFLYLLFFTAVYWWLLDRLRRSRLLLEVLPTGPESRPASRQGFTAASRPRLSVWAVSLFAVHLLLFCAALLGGLLTLEPVGDLALAGLRDTEGLQFVLWLVSLQPGPVRTVTLGVALAVGVGLVLLFGLLLLGWSAVRAREERGRELVGWAFLFWGLSVLLLGAQGLSVAKLLGSWERARAQAAAGRPEALTLGASPLEAWVRLQSLAREGEPRQALRFLSLVLEGRVEAAGLGRHWLVRSAAAGLLPRAAGRLLNRRGLEGVLTARDRDTLDEAFLRLLRVASVTRERVVRQAAALAFQSLPAVPVSLPRTEALLESLARTGRAPAVAPGRPSPGAFAGVLRGCLAGLHAPASGRACRRLLGQLAATGREAQVQIVAALQAELAAAPSAAHRERILRAALSMRCPRAAPLYRAALRAGGDLRRRALQVLGSVFMSRQIPRELRRVHFRWRWSAAAGRPRYEEEAARLWDRFLSRLERKL